MVKPVHAEPSLPTQLLPSEKMLSLKHMHYASKACETVANRRLAFLSLQKKRTSYNCDEIKSYVSLLENRLQALLLFSIVVKLHFISGCC